MVCIKLVRYLSWDIFNLIIIFILRFQGTIFIIINNYLATLLYNADDHIIIYSIIPHNLLYLYFGVCI